MSVYGVGVRRRRRRRGKLVATQLLLNKYDVSLNTPNGSTIGAVTNKIAGSTLSIIDDDSSRFSLSGTNIVAGSNTITSNVPATRIITLLETQPNGVKQYSKISFNILSTSFVGGATNVDFSKAINSGIFATVVL